MKKLWTMLLAATLTLSLVSCSGGSGGSDSSYDSGGSSTTSPHDSETQRNIDSIAEAYGTDSKNIENSINKILND